MHGERSLGYGQRVGDTCRDNSRDSLGCTDNLEFWGQSLRVGVIGVKGVPGVGIGTLKFVWK